MKLNLDGTPRKIRSNYERSADYDEIRRLRKLGKSIREICLALNCTSGTVTWAISKYNMTKGNMEKYDFKYDSDFIAEFWNKDETVAIEVILEFKFENGHVYDTPFGPMGHGTAITETKVIGVFTELNGKEICLYGLYLTDREFKKEVEKAILRQDRSMCERVAASG